MFICRHTHTHSWWMERSSNHFTHKLIYTYLVDGVKLHLFFPLVLFTSPKAKFSMEEEKIAHSKTDKTLHKRELHQDC